jgi:phosphoribosyl-AMP cyclohydrolase
MRRGARRRETPHRGERPVGVSASSARADSRSGAPGGWGRIGAVNAEPRTGLDPEIRALLKPDPSGLVAAVVQQHDTGEVLMLAWMDEEALRRTLATGRATYWSRSRNRYWVKGETSGHVQHVRSVAVDCDGDALLVRVEQTGPACHTGTRSCFSTRIGAGPAAGAAGPGEAR